MKFVSLVFDLEPYKTALCIKLDMRKLMSIDLNSSGSAILMGAQ